MVQALQSQIQTSIPSLEDSLRLGQSLHLEFEANPNLNGGYHLWGICPNKSIMVSAPQLVLSDELLNSEVKARLFIEQLDSACAFRTRVADLCASPSNYLHLAMPTSMVTGEVRRNHRARISLACEIDFTDSQDIAAEIIDASICGCRLNTHSQEVRIGDTIKLKFDIQLYGITQTIKLTAMVRSRSEIADGYSLGGSILRDARLSSHRLKQLSTQALLTF